MKIHFDDANFTDSDDDIIVVEMDVVPRVGESLHIDIDFLSESLKEQLGLLDNEPDVQVFTCFEKKTIYVDVTDVGYVMLSTGISVNVGINLLARLSKKFQQEIELEKELARKPLLKG